MNIVEKQINDYQAFTATTALYPLHIEREYLTLGLCSEAGEIAEMCLDFDRPISELSKTVEELVKELGDCTWYAARLASFYQWPFYELCNAAFRGGLAQLELEGTGRLDTIALELCASAGVAAGVVKKQQRDGHTWSGEKRQEQADKLKGALIDHLQAVVMFTHALNMVSDEDLSLHVVLERNIAKLRGRQERGTVQGDGDGR